jgi:hypothetical protein
MFKIFKVMCRLPIIIPLVMFLPFYCIGCGAIALNYSDWKYYVWSVYIKEIMLGF